MCEIESEVRLVAIPNAEKLPITLFVATFLRTQYLHMSTRAGRQMELNARVNSRNQKFIG